MSGDWPEWRELVLSELKDLKEGQSRLEEQFTLIRIEQAKQRVKSGMWGGLAGLIPACLGVALLFLSGGANGG